ncbi:hypothetical protein [Mycobacterium avium]|uniref:Uncharacterized protein n=1 Tax=Mycobacterium avium subsp. hominissuis TaxID=439334 RepID=A0AAI8SSW5_MYCAV|nr:hypothetical protein [Mycobacterium avium]PBA08498.1 hypothetical protein CKJ70_25975 [Mycobacterium avium]BBN50797.1 hypothetical protein JPH1_52720 [Mycobacterium avium subsp. hominissuis]
MGGGREADSERDALRAHVRMRVAFWHAQDRRSITAGPNWLWRGRLIAPLRLADLSASTGELIARRRSTGMPSGALFGAPGPRQARLPRWVTTRRAAYWVIAAALLALAGLVCARAADDRARVGVIAGWGALGCASVALIMAGLLVWSLRDPLRLTPAQCREVNAARRVLDWNPLAGAGKITRGGAYLLEGIAVVSELVNSPAWALPGVDVLRSRFDSDEEIFQIARAAHSLDVHEAATAQRAQLVTLTDVAKDAVRAERHHLTDALLGRLMVLHRCVATLDDVQQRARRVSAETIDVDDRALFGAAAENELAAAALRDLNSDLLAMADGYDQVVAYAHGTSPR